METITSLQNPKIKYAMKLWKKSERDQTGRFLIEGYRELSRALSAKVTIETLYICKEMFLGSNEDKLISSLVATGAKVIVCSPNVFQKLSYRDRPDGLLAIGRQLQHRLENLPLYPNNLKNWNCGCAKTPGLIDRTRPHISNIGSCTIDHSREFSRQPKSNSSGCLGISAHPFYVVAETIEKPGNLGTILRSADAVGADAVIVCDRCTDLHNPNVVRASVGTLFTLPVVEAEGEQTFQWLQKQGISILAATPSAQVEYTQVDLTQPIAIVVGSEQYGLSKRWMEGATLQVRIPMLGVADSLNVAMATTLLLYEVLRQRTC